MKSTLKLALAVALALGTAPALALQLGQIRVKSTLDEPLVAEIPVQLDNLAEAQGLSVELASDADYARAGLARPFAIDLHFNIVTDSTGHKIVLVTSNQPVGDPYLEFLLQVNTRKGKQLREYTVLLDPVIASAPPVEEAAPAASTPVPMPVTIPFVPEQQTPASQLAPGQAQPAAPGRVAAAAPRPARNGEYTVERGDTLYRIASQNRPDTRVSVDQVMLALKQTNPDAFYRDNINSLKSGAILRIPSHDAIDATSVAEARAQVHRQYEDWRGAAARKATMVAENISTPAEPTAGAAKSANASDRLALVPPAQGGGSATSRPGQSGGSSNDTVAGLKQQLATSKESLTSAKQENTDLQSRVKDLEDISGKNQKLLGLKDAQIAELQRKLSQAQQQAGKPAMATSASAPTASATAAPKPAASIAPAASTAATSTTPAATGTSASPAATAATPTPVGKPIVRPTPIKQVSPQTQTPAQPVEALPWYRQPLTWVIAAIVILALILLGLLRRRPRPLPEPLDEEPSLADQFGASPLAHVPDDAAIEAEREDSLHARIADQPGGLDAHLTLCRFYYEHGDAAQFEAAAERMHEHVADPSQPQWLEVLAMGEQLSPAHPLFASAPAAGVVAPDHALRAEENAKPADDEKYRFAFDEPPPEPVAEPGMQVQQPPVAGHDDLHDEVTRQHPVPGFADEYATPVVADAEADWSASAPETDDTMPFSDDPVDTKLDLARAYLDMGDPAGARAMLEEVSNEGTQMQKDEAKRLLEGIG